MFTGLGACCARNHTPPESTRIPTATAAFPNLNVCTECLLQDDSINGITHGYSFHHPWNEWRTPLAGLLFTAACAHKATGPSLRTNPRTAITRYCTGCHNERVRAEPRAFSQLRRPLP